MEDSATDVPPLPSVASTIEVALLSRSVPAGRIVAYVRVCPCAHLMPLVADGEESLVKILRLMFFLCFL